jgi:hypothetical protein
LKGAIKLPKKISHNLKAAPFVAFKFKFLVPDFAYDFLFSFCLPLPNKHSNGVIALDLINGSEQISTG